MSGAIIQGRGVTSPSLDSGTLRGNMRNYLPPRVIGRQQRGWENDLTNARVEDLFANDPTAHSGILSIATNVVGQGLQPQSVLPADRLGLSPEQAKEVSDSMEWLWDEWCGQAHYREQMSFGELQRLGLISLIRNGEMIHLPVMEERPGCRFALRIQDIAPQRMRTPMDRITDPLIHNGVEVSRTGVPVAYWLANPEPVTSEYEDFFLSSGSFKRVPARIGHRRGLFHVFRADSEETFRGVSRLSPAVKFFRQLSDSLDYELVAQLVASSFPVFIGLENGPSSAPLSVDEGPGPEERNYYQELTPGQIMYGNPGEKPEVIESNRPGNNFQAFCTLIMRLLAATLEVPYEVLSKDFSQTNYSSARAALLEAWRMYECYRNFFVRRYCQPVFEMVMEEAWLRGLLELPAGAPDFYEAQHLWCSTKWIGPARGYVDPQKEVAANIAAISAGLMSRSEAIAERGGDVDEVAMQLAREKRLYANTGAGPDRPPPAPAPSAGGDENGDSDERDN